MLEVIEWCNVNNGFLAGILSAIGLLLSAIAVFVAIRTARLPYKKKILLKSYMSLQTSIEGTRVVKTSTVGFVASATNVGNRPVNLRYIGYAFKANGKYKKLNPIDRPFNCEALLQLVEYKCELQR